MSSTQSQILIGNIDDFHIAYQATLWWKRILFDARFKREFKTLLQRNQANDEMVLRCFASKGRIGMRNDQRDTIKFLEKFIDKGLVRLFAFLCLILDAKSQTDDFFNPISSVFQTLSERNRVSFGYNHDNKPLWSHPGIPCLLESLIQLISAEKTKYSVYNARWSINGMCWQVAAENATKLINLAIPDLIFNFFFTRVYIEAIATVIRDRAKTVFNISDEDAKKCPNYYEINGDTNGSFKPFPGYCQVLIAAASKQVDFVKELKTLIEETGAISVFELFVGLR